MPMTAEERKRRNCEYQKKYYHALSPEEKRAKNSSPAVKAAKAKYRSKPESKEVEKLQYKRWYQKNKERKRTQSRLSKYGLTADQYQSILDHQKGLCAICSRPPKLKSSYNSTDGFVIDHCHVTGRVRGLLCVTCNTGLGNFEDSRDFLSSAIVYLETQNADV